MEERIYNFLYLYGLSPKILIFFLSALPVTELRASIPIGILMLKQDLVPVFILSILGNLLPVAPVYFLLEPVSKKISRTRIMRRFFEWLFERAKKRSGLVEKYEALGLMIFIGIPLPGTGVWTGCVIASLLRIRFLPTFLASFGGALIAAIIVMIVTLMGRMAF